MLRLYMLLQMMSWMGTPIIQIRTGALYIIPSSVVRSRRNTSHKIILDKSLDFIHRLSSILPYLKSIER